MGGQMHPNRAWGPGALAVAAATLAAIGLVVIGRSPATDRVTLVRAPVDAFVVTAAGIRHLAVDGEPLTVGDRLVTGDSAPASAELAAAGRMIMLGRDTALGRVARSAYYLGRGSIVIDRRQGPAVEVRTGDVLVQRIGRGAIRIDRSYSVRVGVFSGAASVLTDAARQLDVPALQQVVVVGTALPGAPTALSLSNGDVREQAVAPGLTALDGYLDRLASGLDTSRRAIFVPTAFTPLTPIAAPQSERVIPLVIAKAAGAGDVLEHYGLARGYREQGGSWGVIARLVGNESLGALQAAAAAVIDTGPPGTSNTTEAGPPPLPGLGNAPSASPAVTPVITPTQAPGPAPSGRPTPSPAPHPSPSPTPAPGLVQQIINTVTGLLPSPSPASSTPAPKS